jgi:pimeloyl-ACP methyl ester carboxylesterase
MADILLVHGAWHGAWCWRRVLPLLWAAGHRPHAVTLTGLGERRRELSRDVTLATHVDDVCAAIAAEEMDPVVLVGHSYGGMVITGAAAGAAPGASRPGTAASGPTIARLIYLDAVVPAPGESWSSGHDAETVTARTAAAEASGGLALPPPDPKVFGLAGADRDWVARRQTPQPFAPYREPLAFDAARWRAIPRTFIDCTEPALATIASSRRRVRQQGDWDLHELKAGHDPMIEVPEQLVALLDRIIRSPT